jgi:hypothetical protein
VLASGAGTTSSGSISVVIGVSGGGAGGQLFLSAGSTTAVLSRAGKTRIEAGKATGVGSTGGPVEVVAGDGVAKGGEIYISAGGVTGGGSVGGSVSIISASNAASGPMEVTTGSASLGDTGAIFLQVGTLHPLRVPWFSCSAFV